MSHKKTLDGSRRYWDRKMEQIISGEYVPKCPVDIMIKAINTKLSLIDDDLFKLLIS